MRIDREAYRFLKGKDLSNGHYFPVEWQPVVERNAALMDVARGKNVIHVGCADHIELIAEKRRKNRYLHDLLTSVASSVVGVDVNKEALAEMEKIGFGDLYTPEAFPAGREFDLIVAADVIEHVANVGEFLRELRKFRCERVVITTPNAFRLRNRRLWKAELVNTDHRYWFSPYTLAKNVVESGIEIEKMCYTDRLAWASPLETLRKWWFPICRDGLLIVGKFR